MHETLRRMVSRSASGWHLLLFFILLSLTGCHEAAQTSAASTEKKLDSLEAEVVTVSLQPWARIVRSQGSLLPDEQSVLGSRVAGRVAQVHVDVGDFVESGKPVITLDQDEFELQVTQAEAALKQARSAIGLKPEDPLDQLKPENSPPVREARSVWDEAKSRLVRAEQLQSRQAMTPSEFDEFVAAEEVAAARYASALNSVGEKIALIGVRQAELSLMHQRLEDTAILAPFDGFVQQRPAAPGNYVSVGQTVVVLVRTNPLRFRGSIPEKHAQTLAVGQEVSLKIESIEQPRTAEITRISPTLDQQSRSLMFEAEIPNEDYQLRSGLFVEAEVVIDEEAQAIIIPESAVVQFAGAQKVWKVVEGVTQEQGVLIGEKRGDRREIITGIEPGDVILVDGATGRVAEIKPASASVKAAQNEQQD